jgi:small-conductance mechanosensitive channel
MLTMRITSLGKRLMERIFVKRNIQVARLLSRTSERIFGNVVFWIIILFFLATATRVLGLHTFTTWLGGVVDYLPTVFAGALIIIAGYLVSQIARDITQTAAVNTDERRSVLIGKIVQVGIFTTAILVGAEQIGIKITFLIVIVAAIGFALIGAVTLSLSLGARDYVANLIGAHYLRKRYNIGQRIRVAGFEGRILELADTEIILETAEGRTSLPANVYNKESITLVIDGVKDELF